MQPTGHYHVFSLPQELLNTLILRDLPESGPPEPISHSPPGEQDTDTQPSGPRTCNFCLHAVFSDLNEQRNHFKSDWHRYNVKTRMSGGQSVTEVEFSQLVDALEDSISGSASSSDDESSASDAVDALVSRTKRMMRSPSPESTPRRRPQTAIAWFHSPPSTQIGVYKALLSDPKDSSTYLSQLRSLQGGGEQGRTWAMFMVAGGHFAGAIVRVCLPDETAEIEDEIKRRRSTKKSKPVTEVLQHKTFHRYTTRRKQGGSQSLNDNAKGNAKSAGALLRRYGEQALRDDIRNLLAEWAEDIDACERIWIRASGSNRRIFLDYNDAVIEKGDERLRTFPFPTRRPTQTELARCLQELTQVKISNFTEDELRQQDEAYLASLPKPKPVLPPILTSEPEKPKTVKLSKEEEIQHEKWTRLIEMVSKGRLEPLKSFWEREGANIGSIDAPIPEWTGEKKATLLQIATHSGQEAVVNWLLEVARADPTIPVPGGRHDESEVEENGIDASVPQSLSKGRRRTAYDLASNKGVRDVFRRCAALHPDWWDWFDAARVPSALSKNMEEERDEKKKVRKRGLKEKMREREAKERDKEKDVPLHTVAKPEPQRPSSNLTTQRLGGTSGTIDGIAGLTPEMRAKVERERRARAAEARLKMLGIK